MKWISKSLSFVLTSILSVLSFFFITSVNVNAIELTPSNLELKGWNANPCSSTISMSGGNRAVSGHGKASSIGGIYPIHYVQIGGCGETMWLVPGSFVQILVTFTGPTVKSNPPLWYFSNTSDFQPISHKVVVNTSNSQGEDLTYEIIGKYVGPANPSMFTIGGNNTNPLFGQLPGAYMVVNSVSSWVQIGNGSADVSNSLNGVANKISEVSRSTGNIENGIKNTFDEIHRGNQENIAQQRATTDAVNNQSEQQKNQYNEQKNEEKGREDKGNKDSKKLGSIFSFTVMNPFSPIFDLFAGGGCRPIPTIGKMLNKPNATYCPWFPNNIRSILTPVLGISAMMLIFGFVISWLKKGGI